MQHFKFENWRIGEFDFWCHEQVTYHTNQELFSKYIYFFDSVTLWRLKVIWSGFLSILIFLSACKLQAEICLHVVCLDWSDKMKTNLSLQLASWLEYEDGQNAWA